MVRFLDARRGKPSACRSAIISRSDGLRVWWGHGASSDDWYDEHLLPSLRRWLDLPTEHVLVAHGPLVPPDELAAALVQPPDRGDSRLSRREPPLDNHRHYSVTPWRFESSKPSCPRSQMLSVRVGDDVYGLDDSTSSELLRRLEDASPLEEAQDEPETTLEKLRDALDSEDAAPLDDGDLALIGVVLEAWAVEVDGDLPGDAEELRYAIADRLG